MYRLSDCMRVHHIDVPHRTGHTPGDSGRVSGVSGIRPHATGEAVARDRVPVARHWGRGIGGLKIASPTPAKQSSDTEIQSRDSAPVSRETDSQSREPCFAVSRHPPSVGAD